MAKPGWFFVVTLCLAAAVPSSGAQTKPEHLGIPTDRISDSYQIYSMLMPGQVFIDMDAGGPWAISNTTISEDDVNPRLAPEATLQPPEDNAHAFKEAVDDYNQ